MKKTYSVILATLLVGSGVTGAYAVTSYAEESPKTEAAQQNELELQTEVEQQTEAVQTTTELTPSAIDSKSLQEKMLNAIDNYQYISGSYRTILTPIGVDETVEFEVQQGTNPRSNVVVQSNTSDILRETAFDGEYYWSVQHDKKMYRKAKASKQVELANFDKKAERTFKNEKGEKVFVKRPDPAFSSLAKDVIFPQDYAFWLTPSNHKILGEEKILDRTAVVIEGKHTDLILAEKHQSTYFKMWIDQETGVLLKLEETNGKDEVTNSIEVLSIEFNKKAKKMSTFNVPDDYFMIEKSGSNEEKPSAKE
ncbi:hypothetical protein [uncultured Brevibacillus sp.]|uniref:hypothetical protein n=1 Tax=uncultured Brevibacillus sp. TaxID=169970 RepID=UPI002594F4A8|nr:hypothetical protein [uncultured Brevibacillus sp.]